MRLFELMNEEAVQPCPTCHGDKTVVVGDSQLVFDCSTCKGRGYFGPEHGMSKDVEELEEIKVTKTLAGKRATASQTLAGKQKKKKPNQGKPAVELDKNKDCKELANNLLKGQYKS